MRNKNRNIFSFGLLFFVFLVFLFHASFSFDGDAVSLNWYEEVSALGGNNPAQSQTDPQGGGGGIVGWAGDGLEWVMKLFLDGIRAFFGWFLTAAAMLLTYVIDAGTFTKLANDEAVENSWRVVRDFLNLGFILVLLFSAFATIFQIEKYHLKKIILTLIIMALLVNFSFPISRFVIDAANIPMYYIAQVVLGTESGNLGSIIADSSGLSNVLAVDSSGNLKGSIESYIAAVVFTFIFAITMAALAFMFLVRLVVLIILIIFSPVGFAAAIFPSTQNYANDYWNALFKNAFFGPIMMLMLAISLYVLEAFQQSDINRIAQSNASSIEDANMLAAWAFYFIPVVMIWGGMAWSQKLGAAGSSIILTRANKFASAFPGRAGKGILWAGGRVPWAGQVPAAIKKVVDDRSKRKSRIREDRRDIIAGGLKGQGGSAARGVQARNIERELKDMEEKQLDPAVAKGLLTSKNDTKKVAAARYLARNKYIQDPETLASAAEAAQGSTKALDDIVKNMSGTALDGMSTDQSRRLFEAVGDSEKKRAFSGFDTTTVKAQAKEVKRAFEKEFREKGKVHHLIELDIQTEIQRRENQQGQPLSDLDRQVVRNNYYNPEYQESKLKGRSLADLAKQDVALFKEPAVQNYLAKVAQTTPQNYQRFYADLSPEKRAIIPPPS